MYYLNKVYLFDDFGVMRDNINLSLLTSLTFVVAVA